MLRGALPNLVVIGAMKCGTSALHTYLDHHPEIAMSHPKELNFFFGQAAHEDACGARRSWTSGNWARDAGWYARHFRADAPVRGESSPGYTSPDHPEVAERMAATIPDVRLIYLVRDPLARALSQYRHHRAEASERRAVEQALLDPDSQYVARGRYLERLAPFLAHFPREHILVVAQEDLRERTVPTLQRVFRFAGADDTFRCDAYDPQTARVSTRALPPLEATVRARLADAFRADVQRLRAFTGEPFPAWSV